MSEGSLLRLWGKAPERLLEGREPYPLLAHLLDTSAAAEALWDDWLSPRLRRLVSAELSQGDPAAARRWVALAAGLHDVGKASSVFQLQAGSPRRGVDQWRDEQAERLAAYGLEPCAPSDVAHLRHEAHKVARRHELIGFGTLLPGPLANIGLNSLDLGAHWLATVVGGHHGQWHAMTFDSLAPEIVDRCTQGAWATCQDSVRRSVTDAVGLAGATPPNLAPRRAGVVITLLTGLVVLADWLASSDEVVAAGFERMAAGESPELGARWVAARSSEMRQVVTRTLGTFVAPPEALSAVLGTDSDGRPRQPRPLQADAVTVGDGAWFVAYPTGEGKTEAALLRHLACPEEGLIFGLPTRATTDRMQARLQAMLGASGNSVVLSHQFAAAHHVECASEYALDWFTSPVRRLMAPVVAGTCDQVLAGALQQRHAALRLLALANHHVVLDEVHTFSYYQTHLLKELMSWWGATGTRVTLLSATLPAWQQDALASAYVLGEEVRVEPRYPAHRLVTSTVGAPRTPSLSAALPPLRMRLVRSDEGTAEHVRWALQTHRDHPRCHVAVIRSTVDDAIDTARLLVAELGDSEVDVVCLHSRMTVAHRRAVEAQLETRLGPQAGAGRPVIVVATQVVEASLDLDFDLMSTDLVPAPALIQRAGRLWRFRDPSRRVARFHGTLPQDRWMHVVVRTAGGAITDGSSLPYAASELRRVVDRLADGIAINIPDDVQDLVDTTTLNPQRDVEAAGGEVGHLACEIEAAERVTTPLRKCIAAPTKRTRYKDLATMTGGVPRPVGDDPARMGTRYVDRESASFILVDGPFGCGLSAEEIARTRDPAEVAALLSTVVPLSGRHLTSVLAIVGEVPWNPNSTLLKEIRPLDGTVLESVRLRYDPLTGLSARADEGE